MYLSRIEIVDYIIDYNMKLWVFLYRYTSIYYTKLWRFFANIIKILLTNCAVFVIINRLFGNIILYRVRSSFLSCVGNVGKGVCAEKWGVFFHPRSSPRRSPIKDGTVIMLLKICPEVYCQHRLLPGTSSVSSVHCKWVFVLYINFQK